MKYDICDIFKNVVHYIGQKPGVLKKRQKEIRNWEKECF